MHSFYDAGAGGYDRMMGRVSRQLALGLLKAAQLVPGADVVDVGSGTEAAAAAALEIVGAAGSLVATDISRPMLSKARERLRAHRNARFVVADAQRLQIADGRADAVICGLALMFFSDQGRGLSEMRRILRTGGHCAVSVATRPERSFVSRVNAVIGRHVLSRAAAAAKHFSLGDAHQLRHLFEDAGFKGVEVATESHSFPFASFDAYFGPVETGEGATGAEYLALPPGGRAAVRDEVRRELEPSGGPDGRIEVPVDILIASGSK